MAKQFKTTTILADNEGKGWVEAKLSEAQVRRLVKAYKRAGVNLTAYGSPNQVMAQVKGISEALSAPNLVQCLAGELLVDPALLVETIRNDESVLAIVRAYERGQETYERVLESVSAIC
jgi:hypothetical protein